METNERDIQPLASRRRRRKRLYRKIVFIIATNVLMLSLLAAIGEYAVRAVKEGGLRAGFRSFFEGHTPESYRGTDNWLVYDDELGYRLNPARVDEHGTHLVNSIGLRNHEITSQKPPGVCRLIVLGDSIAYTNPPGAVDSSVVSLTRRGLEAAGRVEVINACIPGYTTYQERRLLERDLIPLKPDVVVLQYCLNDNHHFLHRFDPKGKFLWTQEAKAALSVPGDGWWAKLNRSSYLLFEIRERWFRFAHRSKSRFPWDDDFVFATAWQDRSWDEFRAQFHAIASATRTIGAKMMVVVVPIEAQLRRDLIDADTEYTCKPQRLLKQTCDEEKILLLDLYPKFVDRRDEKLYFDQVHLTVSGTTLVSNELKAFLKKRAFVP